MTLLNLKRLIVIFALVSCLLIFLTLNAGPVRPALVTGDIIFQESKSSQSEAIRLATGSRYSHAGMVVVKGTQISVLEAVGRVKYTPIKQWIAKGDDGHFIVKRYQVKGQHLDTSQLGKLIIEGEKFLNLPYDPYFLWSDEKQYCSELIYKIYKRALGIELSPLTQMRSFDLTHPVVKAKMQERFGNNPPLDELVVPPSALFDSKLLRTIPIQ